MFRLGEIDDDALVSLFDCQPNPAGGLRRFAPILALGGPCGGWATHTPNSFPIHIIYIYAERFRTTSTIRGDKRPLLGI